MIDQSVGQAEQLVPPDGDGRSQTTKIIRPAGWYGH
jgi:hypothetical protein